MGTPSVDFPRTAAPATLNPVSVARPAKNAGQTEEAKASTQTGASASTLRSEQNAQILQASMDVSIKSGSSSLALLFRTAIDSINEYLEPELGPNAINSKNTADNTPEGTAGRILSLSTAFFDAYAAQTSNKDKDPDTLARDFVGLIRSGFERGFGEARDILSGLGVLGAESPIEQGINKTYALVMQGFDDFLTNKLDSGSATNSPTAGDAKAA